LGGWGAYGAGGGPPVESINRGGIDVPNVEGPKPDAQGTSQNIGIAQNGWPICPRLEGVDIDNFLAGNELRVSQGCLRTFNRYRRVTVVA